MSRADLKVRADAIRAEAMSVRGDARDAYFKRRTELELERERIATAKDAADHAATRATDRASASHDAAHAGAGVAVDLDQEAAKAASGGDARDAEETAESAEYTRRGRDVDLAREQQAALDGARYREEAAGHDRRLKELDYEIKANNRSNTAAEDNLDKLEDQARLYAEADRKFSAAEAAGDDIPMRAQFELEAEAAMAQAEGLVVDRGAIRVFAPELPDSTPGIGTQSSALDTADVDWSDVVGGDALNDMGASFAAVGSTPDSWAFGAGDDLAVDAFGGAPPRAIHWPRARTSRSSRTTRSPYDSDASPGLVQRAVTDRRRRR